MLSGASDRHFAPDQEQGLTLRRVEVFLLPKGSKHEAFDR